MTNPFGEIQYDRDGLPISNPQPQRQNPYMDPFSQPAPGYADPLSSSIPNVQIPQQGQQFAQVPAPYGAGLPGVSAGVQKQWVVAALLAFFLGPWGVHNFYLGYKQKGFIQLALTGGGLITSVLFIGVVPMVIASIWAFVEFIMILLSVPPFDRDAQGLPLGK